MAITLANENNIKDLIKEGFVLVDAFGDGCAPCKMLSKALEELYYEMPFLEIVKINTSENRNFAKEYSIVSVPTLFIVKEGEIIFRESGFKPVPVLRDLVGKHLY